MLTKKQRRALIGRRTDQEEYPRISFMQGLDFAINAKRAKGLRVLLSTWIMVVYL